MTVDAVSTIGFLGAGNIGTNLARLALAHGYDVVLSNSRRPESLRGLVDSLGPGARAATSAEAARAGDVVVVAVPLHAVEVLPAAELTGKVVIDANNYYPQRDGQVAELDEERTTTSELVQRHLPGARVVKAFNHIYAADIPADDQPHGAPDRRALAIAGDDAAAKQLVTALVDDLGYDVVDLGGLGDSWRIQRDTPGYGPPLGREDLEVALAAATRPPS